MVPQTLVIFSKIQASALGSCITLFRPSDIPWYNQLVIEREISLIAERTYLRHVTVIVLREIDIGEYELCE